MGTGTVTGRAGITIAGREAFPTPFADRFFEPWTELRDDGKYVPTALILRDDAEYIRDRIAEYERTIAYAKALMAKLIAAYEGGHGEHFIALLEDARLLSEEP